MGEDVMRQRPLGPSFVGPSAPLAAAASSSSAPSSTPVVVPEALVDPLSEAIAAVEVEALPLNASSFVASPSGKWHRLSHCRGLGNFSAGWTAACRWDYRGPSVN